ncbi:MAG: DUF5805 domain-containing protein [Halobacteriota archaeon]
MPDANDRERTSVKTYVPRYQKREWSAHAEALDMSQSEYVRAMVQAGRSGFELGDRTEDLQGGSDAPDPGGDDLESRLLDALRSEGILTWDDLLERLSGDFEDRLESAIDSLTESGSIRYSPRDGGYEVIDQ